MNWLPQYGIELYFGLDGIAAVMILLTSLVLPFVILFGNDLILNKSGRMHFFLHLTQAALMGVFLSLNVMVFYIFWEIALLPVFIAMIVWGGENRQAITLKFFIYTFLGSLSLLFAFLYIYFHTPEPHSFNFEAFLKADLPAQVQSWLFWFLFIGFAIKLPLFPFHSWQPQTYTVAPTQITMLLSALLMKMGVYGMLRWLLPLVPQGIVQWSQLVIILSLTGMVYAAIMALQQKNLKTLIAWSSISHGGLIGAAIFAVSVHSVQGVIFQSFSHAIIITGLFAVVMIIEKKTGNTMIANMGGIRIKAPVFAAFFLILVLGSIGLPLTNGFVAEFLMILGIYAFNPWLAFFGGFSIILGAIYMLYAYQKVCLGNNNNTLGFTEINKTEMILFGALSLIVVLTGVLPGIILNLSQTAVDELFVNFYSLTNY
jgi:NADH-quinone oxidoreductase subunit M